MYAKYAYLANVTQAQVLSDVVAILTGETNKANLSAGCDQANTEISAAYEVAGWTVHDAAASTNSQVLKAACDGDAAQFKYMRISTATSGNIWSGLYEAWNATTHVGTNVAPNSDSTSYGQRYATAAAGTLYISASANRALFYGVYSGGNGNLTYLSSSGVLEFDRGYTWCAVGQGFMPACFFGGNNDLFFSRSKDVSGAVNVSGSSVLVTMGMRMTGNVNAFSTGNGGAMSSGFAFPVSALAGHPSGVSNAVPGFTVSGVFSNPAGYALNLDEVPYNSKTYVCFPVSSTGVGHSKILVPKG
jgi:hypothetical protein